MTAPQTSLALGEITIDDSVQAWRALGFDLDAEGWCSVGEVRIQVRDRPQEHRSRITSLGLNGMPIDGSSSIDGIGCHAVPGAREARAGAHPNGVVDIDHLVVLSPNVSRTIASLREWRLNPRRERAGEFAGRAVRQVFYRMGSVILELVGEPDAERAEPARLWGITFVVQDLDHTVGLLDEQVTRPKDAVQAGRRICTVRSGKSEVGIPVAFISA